jgi:hypothetical protein
MRNRRQNSRLEKGRSFQAVDLAIRFMTLVACHLLGVELGLLLFIASIINFFLILRRISLALFQINAGRPRKDWMRGGAYCIGASLCSG